jgi:hypothetical protein
MKTENKKKHWNAYKWILNKRQKDLKTLGISERNNKTTETP